MYKIRQQFVAKIPSIMLEAEERMHSNIDPLTSEPWEGDKALFNMTYKTALEMLKASRDAPPKAMLEAKFSSTMDRIKLIVKYVRMGELDPVLAMEQIAPELELMGVEQKEKALQLLENSRVTELEDLINRIK